MKFDNRFIQSGTYYFNAITDCDLMNTLIQEAIYNDFNVKISNYCADTANQVLIMSVTLTEK